MVVAEEVAEEVPAPVPQQEHSLRWSGVARDERHRGRAEERTARGRTAGRTVS